MKKLAMVIAAMVLLAVLIPAAAMAGGLSEKEKKGIETLAEIYFRNRQVCYYKDRVFVRDNAGYLLTFKLVNHHVSEEGLDGRRGYEEAAALFLISVSDYLRHPARGPLGLGEGNVIAGTISGRNTR